MSEKLEMLKTPSTDGAENGFKTAEALEEAARSASQANSILLAVILTVAIVVITIIVLFKRGGKKPPIVKNKGNTVFIMGECGAGKTALLYKLAKGADIQTASSIEPTETTIEVALAEEETKKISFIDVPGHNYTKLKYISELGSARGVIFLVDSSNINGYGNAVDYLYTMMIQRVFQDKEIPVLICANKSDLPKALSLKDFEHLLVKEVEKVKRSKRAIHEEENDQIEDYIKHSEQEFSFQNTAFQLCEISVVKDQLQPIKDFLSNIFA